MTTSGSEKCRVVLIPLPFQGHIAPILQLGSILYSKGFSITVAHTEYNAPNPSNHPEFDFLALADNLAGFDTSFGNSFHVILAINNNCRAPLLDYLVESKKDEDSHGQISCIIYDSYMYFAGDVAAHLKIPSMILRTTSADYVHSYFHVFRLQAENYFPLPESQLQEPVPDFQDFRFKDLPMSVSSELPDFIFDISVLDIRSSMGIIWNTAEELEDSSLSKLPLHFNVPIFPIGPFHKRASPSLTSLLKEDTGCIASLDKQSPKSVIYVSLGSIVTMGEKELEATAWGLANSGQPFLWVIRPLSINISELLEQLPEGFKEIVGERGLIIEWAPQRQVLAHSAVGGFWTHCGWNSILEMICEGVPMICRPSFSDQLINNRYITHVWKVGLELEPLSDRRVIEKSIKRLMVEDEGKEMRKRILNMKQKLEASVQHGGSSHKSLNDLTELILSSSSQKLTTMS